MEIEWNKDETKVDESTFSPSDVELEDDGETQQLNSALGDLQNEAFDYAE